MTEDLYLDIESATKENTWYRKPIFTNDQMQIILQCLQPGEFVEFEEHEHSTQFVRCEVGLGIITMDGWDYTITDGVIKVIGASKQHQIRNISEVQDLKFYTIYAPPVHEPDEFQERMSK